MMHDDDGGGGAWYWVDWYGIKGILLIQELRRINLKNEPFLLCSYQYRQYNQDATLTSLHILGKSVVVSVHWHCEQA